LPGAGGAGIAVSKGIKMTEVIEPGEPVTPAPGPLKKAEKNDPTPPRAATGTQLMRELASSQKDLFPQHFSILAVVLPSSPSPLSPSFWQLYAIHKFTGQNIL
jgi:hypothetical protein